MPTSDLLVRNLEGADLERLAAFCARYRQAYPGANLLPPELYANHPDLEQGRNVFCVLDREQRLVGFAPLFPVPLADDRPPQEPHHIWTIVVADPGREDASVVRDLLLGRVLERAGDLKATMAPRTVRLAAELMAEQRADVEHLLARGFTHYESMHLMRRGASDPIPTLPAPEGVTIRPWRMPSSEEQQSYLQAFNTCFPEMPKTLEALQFFLQQSPLWAAGTAFAAFDPHGALAGSIHALRDLEHGWGVADDVFVLPAWRRRGIARFLLAEGLRYLRAQGVPEVFLQVLASNTPAVSLYGSLGYAAVSEKLLLGRYI